MSSSRQLPLLDVERPMADWEPDPEGEHGEVFTRRWVVDLILNRGMEAIFRMGG